ncbi:MAG TPA: chemotaxis-specific protein-glutamate methyltransferase CheB [Allosphingosinicella sp.]|jgi:two-component system chemotaxis response regulator CheB
MGAPTTFVSPRSDPTPIRLMIVDDSPIARAVLSRMLSAYKEFEVVALAGNAGEALDALKTVALDIVLLDVEMPGTTGLQALPEILRLGRGARVLIVSSLCEDGAEATVKALALGAADTLPKPGTGNFGGRFSEVLAERLRRIGRVERQEPAPAELPDPDQPELRLRAMPDAKLGCLALGASTGGLYALSEFLKALPPAIGAPILVTQHLPGVFMPFFARQIENASGRTAVVAQDGMPLKAETVFIAPGSAHLGLERLGGSVNVKLSTTPASSGCLPSVDPMLWSLSEIYGRSGVGVIFSGMGRDGLVGSARLVERGGAVLVQNRDTSAVWGMPRAVAEAGLACAVLSPADLARRVAARAVGGAWR